MTVDSCLSVKQKSWPTLCLSSVVLIKSVYWIPAESKTPRNFEETSSQNTCGVEPIKLLKFKII